MFQKHWYLILIILLAAALRLYRLDSHPTGLYWEEVALGYDAFSILKTGKDHHGNPWPLVSFTSYGDFKPSGYFYFATPFVALFGLNEWGVRLPSAFAGVVTVVLVFLIALELGKNWAIGLWSAFLMAILPWHIQFSRAAFEANVAVMWMCLGIWLFLIARKKPNFIFLSLIPFVLAIYTYHSARIAVPLLAVGIWLIYWKKYPIRNILEGGLLAIGLCLPILLALKSPAVTQRFAETNYFSHSDAVSQVNEWREEDKNTALARIVHHRYWYWGKDIIGGIFSHLNPNFLFLNGDTNPRHQTGFIALMFWWMIIPLVLGVKKVILGRDQRMAFLYFIWFMAAGLAPALTNLTPHTLRFLLAAPLFALVMGFGMYELQLIFKKLPLRNFLTIATAIGIALTQVVYLYDYYTRYANKSSQDWQFAYKEAMQIIKDRGDQDIQVYLSPVYGRAYMYVLFYLQYPPHIVQSMRPLLRVSNTELLEIDKFQFIDPELVADGLVITEKPYHRGTLINQINFLDDNPALYVYEI